MNDERTDPMLCPTRAKTLPAGMKWVDVTVSNKKQ